MMKKALSLILALVMCLSLCACGNSEELEKYKKYETLINFLEAEDYANAYQELLKISMGMGSNSTKPTGEEKKYVTIEITMDNWQEYFEIRPYEKCFYNDFGDLIDKEEGYAFYLKAEHLTKLAKAGPHLPDGSVKVSFKAGMTVEFREYDQDKHEFVENGKIHSVEEEEVVVKLYDYRSQNNTTTNTSTGYGQVFGKMWYNGGIGVYMGVYTENIDVIDVTGTLVFQE